MVEIKTKIIKAGNSYGIRIPKALIDCKVLREGATYDIIIKQKPFKAESNSIGQDNAPVVHSLNFAECKQEDILLEKAVRISI